MSVYCCCSFFWCKACTSLMRSILLFTQKMWDSASVLDSRTGAFCSPTECGMVGKYAWWKPKALLKATVMNYTWPHNISKCRTTQSDSTWIYNLCKEHYVCMYLHILQNYESCGVKTKQNEIFNWHFPLPDGYIHRFAHSNNDLCSPLYTHFRHSLSNSLSLSPSLPLSLSPSLSLSLSPSPSPPPPHRQTKADSLPLPLPQTKA